ncbi:hypothetical protein [Streptomyces sp. NPDC093544]|uniref:hypothetical protein n=1 Tax=Streptomyces sp. NPDC093544 TaxID=3155200 RepID=UPI00341DC96B
MVGSGAIRVDGLRDSAQIGPRPSAGRSGLLLGMRRRVAAFDGALLLERVGRDNTAIARTLVHRSVRERSP